ncbi:MAG: hypothetical protein JW788_03155, partial [Candidatus Omnitrophica bacterium]|nr:hypothetical protein [Candidatus Omnitrophota bacterium]
MNKIALKSFGGYFCIILILAAVCFLTTFPLFTRFDSVIPGFMSTDESYNVIWDNWRIKHAFSHKLSFGDTDLIAYPFGGKTYASGVVAFSWLIWTYFLSLILSPAASYNLQVVLNMLLMAVGMFILVSYLTRSKGIGIFSGIIFGFCPYQFARSWQHLSLTYNQWIVFIILSALLLKEKPSRVSAQVFFLSVFLALSFDFSIMYMSFISLLLFFIYVIFYGWRKKSFKLSSFSADTPYFKKSLLAVLLAVIILSPQFILILKNAVGLSSALPASAHNLYHRPFEDLFS